MDPAGARDRLPDRAAGDRHARDLRRARWPGRRRSRRPPTARSRWCCSATPSAPRSALVFLAGMALLPPDGKRFYASLGLVVAYLELVGTALGAWTLGTGEPRARGGQPAVRRGRRLLARRRQRVPARRGAAFAGARAAARAEPAAIGPPRSARSQRASRAPAAIANAALRLTRTAPASRRASGARRSACGRRDSNPHGLRHRLLRPACLPIPPRPLVASGRAGL